MTRGRLALLSALLGVLVGVLFFLWWSPAVQHPEGSPGLPSSDRSNVGLIADTDDEAMVVDVKSFEDLAALELSITAVDVSGAAIFEFSVHDGKDVHTSDEIGKVALSLEVETIVVEAPGFQPARHGITAEESASRSVQVVCHRGLAFSGRIVDREEQPVSGIDLLVRKGGLGGRDLGASSRSGLYPESVGDHAATYQRRVRTDGEGRFHVTGLAPGWHVMTVEAGWRPKDSAAWGFDPEKDDGKTFVIERLYVQAIAFEPVPGSGRIASSQILGSWSDPKPFRCVPAGDCDVWAAARAAVRNAVGSGDFWAVPLGGPSVAPQVVTEVRLRDLQGRTYDVPTPVLPVDALKRTDIPTVRIPGWQEALGRVTVSSSFAPSLRRVNQGRTEFALAPPLSSGEGRFEFRDVPAGEYVLSTVLVNRRTERARDLRTIQVPAGADLEIELDEEVSGIVGVKVVVEDARGEPTSGWWLEVLPMRMWVSGPAQGSQVLLALAKGDYVLQLRALDGTLLEDRACKVADTIVETRFTMK